jgi:hypothetical protein
MGSDMKKKHFKPGTYGCHEALHMAAFLSQAVDNELTEHTAVTRNKEWLKLAKKASQALWDLYQAIGNEHLR